VSFLQHPATFPFLGPNFFLKEPILKKPLVYACKKKYSDLVQLFRGQVNLFVIAGQNFSA
jgi:hypothetical protein